MTSNNVSINEKHEKQMQAMIYAIENYPQINRTKLMKFIFFVDLFAYNNYGDTILENDYYCLKRGPVPKFGFEKSSDILNNNKYFTSKKEYNEDSSYYYSFELKDGVNFSQFKSNFGKNVLSLMQVILNAIKKYNAQTLSDKTHEYELWKLTKENDIISKKTFELKSSKEKHELNDFLNTAIYVSPIDLSPNENKYPHRYEKITESFILPVHINRKNGDVF